MHTFTVVYQTMQTPQAPFIHVRVHYQYRKSIASIQNVLDIQEIPNNYKRFQCGHYGNGRDNLAKPGIEPGAPLIVPLLAASPPPIGPAVIRERIGQPSGDQHVDHVIQRTVYVVELRIPFFDLKRVVRATGVSKCHRHDVCNIRRPILCRLRRQPAPYWQSQA